jgi:hypothetical protein
LDALAALTALKSQAGRSHHPKVEIHIRVEKKPHVWCFFSHGAIIENGADPIQLDQQLLVLVQLDQHVSCQIHDFQKLSFFY